ncbi:MAG: endonuclease/exonuclease/phosphatase family metal-dependent hydrolase [Oleiphilaceae bacterium]|jgi:endonuclease/exonuclease/phosphatase family metal-dependent hydrolase
MKLTSKKLCKTIVSSALICSAISIPFIASAGSNQDRIKVMSRNIYLGADIFPVLAAAQDPNPIAVPMAVTGVFQTVQQTNFPERAQALADEIERRKPDVIGLQEVSTWRTQIPGDFLIGNPKPATDVAYDFLEILQTALEARDLHYNVAVSVDNADLELPMIAGLEADGLTPIFGDLRLSDRDVILVKDSPRISYSTTIANNFTVNGITSVGGTNIEFTRGYTMADVHVRGADYRFVNTHLETGGSEPYNTLQAVQMNELLQVIEATTPESTPVILLGDFNSSPNDEPFTSTSGIPGLDGLALVPPYLQAVGSGYLDLWLAKPKARNGYTCCFDGMVSDEDSVLSERIDHIFFKPKDREINKLKIKILGQSNADMTDESGLYPSDHAGLFGKIKLAK